jgi:hypothetical protein
VISRSLRSSLLLLACSALTSTSAGCSDDGPGPDPCDDDRTGCRSQSDEDFVQNADCTLDGDLDVQVGSGSEQFIPITASSGPEFSFGSQGLSHLFMAVRVENADVVQSPELLVTFYSLIGQAQACEWNDSFPDVWRPEASDVPCWSWTGSRTIIVGSNAPLRTFDGTVVETGWLVTAGSAYRQAQRFGVIVTDQCGRTGHSVVQYEDEE